LGAVRFRDDQIVDRVAIPLFAGRVPKDGWGQFAGLPVVTHDAVSLRASLDPAAVGLGAPWVDTQALTRAVWPEEPDLSLPALTRRLGRAAPSDAPSRAEVTGWLAQRLLAEAGAFPPAARALIADLLPNPDWIGTSPASRPRKRGVAVPRTVVEAFALFTGSGLLSQRDGQVQYAEAVAEALEAGEVRLLEALPRLERLLHELAREDVAGLHLHQRVGAAGGRGLGLRLLHDVRRALEQEARALLEVRRRDHGMSCRRARPDSPAGGANGAARRRPRLVRAAPSRGGSGPAHGRAGCITLGRLD